MAAGDIETERLQIPPIIIPVGDTWETIEDFWSDLVNELPEIPMGANEYFFNTLKPAFGKLSHAL